MIRGKARALQVANIAYAQDRKGDDIYYINEKNERLCVWVSDNMIEIGVAGSNDSKDWLENFKILGKKVDGFGRVPRGFWKNVPKFVQKIDHYLKKYQDREIHISAHSRGVPIGFYIGVLLYKSGYNIKSIIGFGAPNFVKKQGVSYIKKSGIQDIRIYKNGSDQVTRHPWGYKKPIKQIQISKPRRFLGKIFNKDHLISNYIKNI